MTSDTQVATPAAPATPTAPAKPTIPPPKLALPNDGQPLSVHEAFNLLKKDRGGPVEPSPPANPEAVEPEAPAAKAPETEPENPLDVETPSDETDIEVGEDEQPQPGEQPALTAPSSYNAQERDTFAALPRPAQEAALRLEQHRRAAFSRDSEAVRTERASAEGLRQQVEAERQFLLSQVVPLVQQLQAAHAGEFADIRSPQDLQVLADKDPARYLRWQASQVAIEHAERHRQVLAEREQNASVEAERNAGIEQLRKLPELIKSWSTPEALKTGMAEVQGYILKQPGVEQADLRRLNKAAFVAIARKAMLYDQALARKQTASAAAGQPAPVTTAGPKPGRVAAGHAVSTLNKAVSRVRETGSLDDAFAALKASRGASR